MNKTHGMSARNSLYRPMFFVWNSMIQRCTNPKNTRWKAYGGRGIKVCERWLSFMNFAKDMAAGYTEGLTLERGNNDGDYEPGNVTWQPRSVQAKNTRRNVKLEFLGETLTVTEWAARLGFKRQLIGDRLKRGWTVSDALTVAPIEPSAASLGAANVALKRKRSAPTPGGMLL